jgi:hypothetical protein
MGKLKIRKALPPDLSIMQQIARRTIDECYRSFLEDCYLIFSILISGYRNYPHFGLQSIDHKIIWRKSKIIRFFGFKSKSNDIILGYIYSYRIASIGISAEAFLAG